MKVCEITKTHGFTLAEILIVLCVIGFLALIMLLNMHRATPDKYKAMFKKSFSVAERTIGEIVNDESLYPYKEDRVGLLNTDTVTVGDKSFGGDHKFCRLFADRLNLASDIKTDSSGCYFETTDGVAWFVPVVGKDDYTGCDFSNPANAATCGLGKRAIIVDVDGLKKGPNSPDYGTIASACGSSSDYTGFCYSSADGIINGFEGLSNLSQQALNAPNRDRFAIVFDVDGKVSVGGDVERAYLRSSKLSKDDTSGSEFDKNSDGSTGDTSKTTTPSAGDDYDDVGVPDIGTGGGGDEGGDNRCFWPWCKSTGDTPTPKPCSGSNCQGCTDNGSVCTGSGCNPPCTGSNCNPGPTPKPDPNPNSGSVCTGSGCNPPCTGSGCNPKPNPDSISTSTSSSVCTGSGCNPKPDPDSKSTSTSSSVCTGSGCNPKHDPDCKSNTNSGSVCTGSNCNSTWSDPALPSGSNTGGSIGTGGGSSGTGGGSSGTGGGSSGTGGGSGSNGNSTWSDPVSPSGSGSNSLSNEEFCKHYEGRYWEDRCHQS